MMGTARYHMGLKGRGKIPKRNRLPVITDDGVESVPIDEHPSALIVPKMPPPTFYYGTHETEDLPAAVQMYMTPMVETWLSGQKD
jgi:hypothetical protein